MYRVEVNHAKDLSFSVKSGNHEFIIDAKGADGISPPDALLASVGSCLGVYIRKYAQGVKIALENFSMTFESEFTKETPIS